MIKIEGAVKIFGDFNRGSSGKLLLDFLEFCRTFQGPVKILKSDWQLDEFNHQFIVQHLFQECGYTSLISTSVTPS
jgi:hypothetical protein